MRKNAILFLLLIQIFSLAAIPVETLHCDFDRVSPSTATVYPFIIRKNTSGWLLHFPQAGRYTLNLPRSERWRSCPLEASVYARLLSGKAFVKLNFLSRRGNHFVSPGAWITEERKRVMLELHGMDRSQVWRLPGIQIDVAAETRIQLDSIMLSEERPETEAFRFSIDTGGLPLPVFHNDTLKHMKIRVHNGSNRKIERRVHFRFTGLDGKQFGFHREIRLQPYETIWIELPEKPPHYGVWYGETESDGSRLMFAYVPENGLKTQENPEFEFAVDNHWIDPEVIEAMRYMGIRAVRTIVGWERVQPLSSDHWNFKVFEQRLEALEKAGIKMRETLVFTPHWAAESNPKKVHFPRNRKPKMAAWENYVRAMVRHYGSRVEFFELWNEPDLSGFWEYPVDDYIRLCRRAREIAKETDPNCKFASGGFATLSPGHPGNPGKFHEAVLREAKDLFDIHSYHEHGYFPHYQQMVDGYFLPLRKKYSITAPWLASETAMHSAKGMDVAQADCLFKKLLFTWARGGFSYTWYGLCNNGYDLNYSEDNFGLFDKYMNPKYAFGSYTALIRVYNEARFAEQLYASGTPWLFAFRTPQAMLLANWSVAPEGGENIYAVSAPDGTEAEQLDLDGISVPAPYRNGIALVSVKTAGSTLRVTGAKSMCNARLVAELILPAAIFPENPVSGTLRLINPWREKITCNLMPETSETLKVSGLPEKIELDAGAEQLLPFHLISNADNQKLTLKLCFAGQPEICTAVPLNFAKLLGGTDFQNRKPDFILKNYSQVEGNFEFDPAKTAELWQGFDDLSVELWLGRKESDFELLAKVRDDKHYASLDNRLWEGDSIQFHLGFAGQKGFFELGAGLTKKHQLKNDCWIVPDGFNIEQVRKAMKTEVKRHGLHTIYQISIPFAVLGISPDTLKCGFRFNFLANDNDDGIGRKCFIRLAPGIGSGQTMEHAPMMIGK